MFPIPAPVVAALPASTLPAAALSTATRPAHVTTQSGVATHGAVQGG